MPRQEESIKSSTNGVDTSRPRGLVASTNRPRPTEGAARSRVTATPLHAPRRRGRRRYAGRKVSGSEVGHLDHLDCLDGEGAVVTQGATRIHAND